MKLSKRLLALSILLGVVITSMSFISSVKAIAEVNILNHTGYRDSLWASLRWYHVVGEVENTGDVAVKWIEIEATFYDESDAMRATENDYIMSTLNPGRKAPFEITLMNEVLAAEVHHYDVRIVSYDIATPKPIGLEIPYQYDYIDRWDRMIIYGEIKNIGSMTATSVNVVATYYDTDGNVVGSARTYVQPSDIQPNLTIPFEISFWDTDRVDYVDSYALEAESNEYVLVPEFSTWSSILLILIVFTVATAICRRRLLKTPIQ
jgi:hypothetical protein